MQSTAKLSSKIAFCVAVWLIGSPIATAQPMLQHLEIPRGYQPLDYPRDFGGASLAGQLVQLSRGKGFRHLGHLRDCGLPESALKPTSGLVGLAALSRKSARLEASITATFLSLFGLEFKGDAARQVEITLDGAIEEYLSPLAVVGAARAYDELLQERCGNLLRLANVYWINSAIKVEKLSLRLLNSAGGQLAGSAQELGAYVSGLDGKADVRVSADGVINIRRPVYVAFRDAPPAELLTGQIQLHTVGEEPPDFAVEFGDELYAKP